MSKPWRPYALHILDAIAKIRRIQARGDLVQDEVLYDAVLRNLQTLSEATQWLPEERKAAFPAIPWREISGFRNILVHRGERVALHNADHDLLVRCQGLDYWCKRVFGNPFGSATMSD